MFWKRKKKKTVTLKNEGGIFFLMTILALAILAVSNLRAMLTLFVEVETPALLLTLSVFIVGMWFAHMFIRNHNAVLIHELKHAIVSGLAGNSWKELRVGREEGHFEFSFSKQSRRLNALVMLAPYFFPLFTLPVLLGSLVFLYGNYEFLVIPVGFALGADVNLAWRDFSPHQTDLQGIIGGVTVASAFIVLMNFVLVTIYLAWGFMDVNGLLILGEKLWELVEIAIFGQATEVTPESSWQPL